MMILKLDETEFETELEKMVVKRMFREKEEEVNETGEQNNDKKSDEEIEEERRVQTELEKIVAESRIIYNKNTNVVDMGNMRASDYKYNR